MNDSDKARLKKLPKRLGNKQPELLPREEQDDIIIFKNGMRLIMPATDFTKDRAYNK